MSYKKSIYDYATEIDLDTVEEVLSRRFLEIASFATQEVYLMNIENTIKEIRSLLANIEDCLNDNLTNPIWETCTLKEYTAEALKLRSEIICLKRKYYDYINDRELQNELVVEQENE